MRESDEAAIYHSLLKCSQMTSNNDETSHAIRIPPQALLQPAQKRIIRLLLNNAGIAQLVEQGFCKPQVRGSSPCAGTKSKGGP